MFFIVLSCQLYNIGVYFQCGLVWFWCDLWYFDYVVLYYVLCYCCEVYCVFVFDCDIFDVLFVWGLKVDCCIEFICVFIEELCSVLCEVGGDFIVVYDYFCQVIFEIVCELNIEVVFVNYDEEFFVQVCDEVVCKLLVQQLCVWFDFKDQVIFECDEILNG